jgi:molybdopterin-guanine dinucleotide biosynthesis protein A
MNIDLTDIYDKGLGTNDPPPESNIKPQANAPQSTVPMVDVSEVYRPASADMGRGVTAYDPSAYTGYLNEPLYLAKGDPNERRGLAQSGWEKTGNFALQTIGKTATTFLEGLGHMGSLAFEWGDRRDYSNSLTESAQAANEWMDKNFPLYRHNTDTLAFNDMSWWLQNIQGLTSSVAAFAVEGAIFGAIANASKLGRGVEYVANLGKKFNPATGMLEGRSIASGLDRAKSGLLTAEKMGQKTKKLMTAGMLAYTEGAMAGKRVYDTVYSSQLNENLSAGLNMEEAEANARHKAAEAAATAVQLNTIVNTGFNFFGGVGEFFNHEKNAVISTAKKNLFMTAEEAALGADAMSTFLKRLGTETAEKFKNQIGKGKSWATVGREATAEGLEELTNNWAVNTGIEHGKKGEVLGFGEQLKTLQDYFTTAGVLDQDGALSFVMGAVAGPLNHGLASVIPMHKVVTGVETKTVDGREQYVNEAGEVVERYEDAKKKYLPGKFGTNLVSKRTLNEFGANQYFNDIKSKIEADYTMMADIQDSIKDEMAKGNFVKAEQLRTELFNVANTNAVSMGYAENLKATYQSFKNVDNTKSARAEVQAEIEGLTQALEQVKKAGQDTTELQAQLTAAQAKEATASDKTAAMEMNLTDSKDNNDYIAKADEAIRHLDNVQKIHDGVTARVGTPDNDMDVVNGHVSDQIFQKLSNLYFLKEAEKSFVKELEEADATAEGNMLGDVDNDADLQLYSRRVNRLADAHEDLKGKLTRIDAALKANDYSTVMDLIKEHGANGVTSADAPKAIKELQKKLLAQANEKWDEYLAEKENLVNTPLYEKWASKNLDKNIEHFLTQVTKEKGDSMLQRQLAQALESTRSQIKTHEEFAKEIQSSKTLSSIKAKTERNLKNLQKERDAFLKERLRETEAREQAEATRRADNIKLMKELQVRYKAEMEQIKLQKRRLTTELRKLALDVKLYNPKYTSAEEFEGMKLEKAKLEYELDRLKARVITLQTLWNETKDVIEEEEAEPIEETSKTEPPVQPQDSTPEPMEKPEPVVGNPENISQPIELSIDVPEDIQPEPTPAQDALAEILKAASDKGAIMDLYERMQSGEQVSLDILKGKDLGGLTSPQVVTAIHAALKELGHIAGELEEMTFSTEDIDTSFEDDTNVDIDDTSTTDKPATSDMVHDGFETNNPTPDEVDRFQSQAEWSGKIQKHPASKMAQSTFIEKTVTDEITGNKRQERLGELEENLDPDVVDGDRLKKETPLTLKLDESFEGTDDEPAFFTYLDKNGFIKTDDISIGNVPIKITWPGSTKGTYVHTVKWIEEEIKGSAAESKYRNCVPVLRDEFGKVIEANNVAREVARVMKLRRVLVQNYNTGIKEGIMSKVISKGPGTIPFLREYSPASSNLPGVKLGVVTNNGVFAGVGHERLNIPKDMSKWYGRTVALIPMNDGSYTPITLQGKKVDECRGALATMIRVTEIHLEPNADNRKAEAEQIKQATGFDILDLDGYRNFMIQYYTYFTSIEQLGKAKSAVVFDAKRGKPGEATSWLAIARKNAGSKQNKPVVAKMENGKLSNEFKAELRALAGMRFKSIALEDTAREIKGVNSSDEFVEILYNSDTKTWDVTENKSYTDYAKKFLFSNVKSNGVITRSNGESMHVFAGNPIIEYDMNTTSTPVEYNEATAFPDEEIPNVTALNDINETINPAPVAGTSSNSTPVTRDQVQKIYDKLYDKLYEAGEDTDVLAPVDAIFQAARDNNWTIDMIESKIKCG